MAPMNDQTPLAMDEMTGNALPAFLPPGPVSGLPGEAPEQAAVRELREETGLRVPGLLLTARRSWT